MPDTTASDRRRAFVAVVGLCAAIAAGSVAWGLLGGGSGSGVAGAPAGKDGSERATRVPAREAVVFRSLDRDDPTRYGRIAWAPTGDPVGRRSVGGLACERVHFEAGRGICLSKTGGLGTAVEVRILDDRFRPRHQLRLNGVPSRARVSPDGRYGTVTAFVSGHSYAEAGKFSTQTTLIDLVRGRKVADVEDFVVEKDGERFDSIDFNFWGVTFARDPNRFYATLGSGDETYLVRGDVRARTAVVLRENAECPSLSPDGRRVVYKKRVGDPEVWRYHVLDLSSGRETALAEERPIDDQAEWLGAENVLYKVGEQIWSVPADGSGRPRLYLARADSPAVVRSIGGSVADHPASLGNPN